MMGVYGFVPSRGYSLPLYIGYSKNIHKRVRQHFLDRKPYAHVDHCIVVQEFTDKKEALECERNLIKKFKPKYNIANANRNNMRLLKMPETYVVESIDYMLDRIQPYPWKNYSMIDRINFNINRQWIEENTNV